MNINPRIPLTTAYVCTVIFTARTGKIGGAHVYFKICWEDIITAGMADSFCDRPGSVDDSTELHSAKIEMQPVPSHDNSMQSL